MVKPLLGLAIALFVGLGTARCSGGIDSFQLGRVTDVECKDGIPAANGETYSLAYSFPALTFTSIVEDAKGPSDQFNADFLWAVMGDDWEYWLSLCRQERY